MRSGKNIVPAEFEERSYEAPLYNQLERGNSDVFTPGQVLESLVGFDRGLYLAESSIWEILGYTAPLNGAALGYYDWPYGWGPPYPRRQLPRFRLNLFLQTKRSHYVVRTPRALRGITDITIPLWKFEVQEKQQKLLEVLASKTRGRAHIAYAAAAFHTSLDLFRHTSARTIVQNSTFPSVTVLSGHEAWYYKEPGATGVANPDPEAIRESGLLERIRTETPNRNNDALGLLGWLDLLASDVIASVAESIDYTGAVGAQYLDDTQSLERIAELYSLRPSLLAYAQVRLFAIRFDLSWLILTDSV